MPRPFFEIAVAAASCMAAGCASEEVALTFGGDADLGFFVELDGVGNPVSAGPLMELDRVTRYDSEGGEATILITFPESELGVSAPGYEPSRRSELALVIGTPQPGPSFVFIPLPASAQIYQVDLDKSALVAVTRASHPGLGSLRLRVPSDREFCSRRQPFEIRSLPGVLPTDAERLAALGQGQLLGVSASQLYLIEPTGALDQATTMGSGEPGPGVRWFYGATESRQDPVPTAWVVGREGGLPAAWRIEAEASTLKLVETTTLSMEAGRLSAASVDHRGTVVLVGAGGLAFARAPGAERFERVDLPLDSAEAENVERVISTPLEHIPQVIAASMDTVVMGDALGTLTAHTLRPPRALMGTAEPRVTVLASSDDGLRIWAGGRLSLFSAWTEESGWKDSPPTLPPTAGNCVKDVESRSYESLGVKVNGLAYAAERLFFLLDNCPALFVTDLEAGCTAAMELPGLDLSLDPSFNRGDVVARDNQVFISTPGGRVFVIDL